MLLVLRDTLAGAGDLDWDDATDMASWTGVTVSGAPPRVTGLNLANKGLTGELSGLLGNLTGLTELRLDGNALTGGIPSKVARLGRLTHVYVGGNALDGCVPPSLVAVANNDRASLGLPDCGAPTDISYGEHTLVEGVYQFALTDDEPPVIFDVPANLQLEIVGIVLTEPGRSGYSVTALILREVGGRSWIALDLVRGVESHRWTEESGPESACEAALARNSVGTGRQFDRIAESVWIGDSP